MKDQYARKLFGRPILPALCGVAAAVIMVVPHGRNELRILDAIYAMAARDLWVLAVALHGVVVFALTYALFALFRRFANVLAANLACIIGFCGYLLLYFQWGTFCC